MGSGSNLFDIQIIENFMKCIAVYPIGTCVELSNGSKGIVMENYSDCILRPILRNLENREVIDLKNDKDYLSICITKIILES
jgi:hypothetical protein